MSAAGVPIDAILFDFERVFPPPDDAGMHRAGRQGMLDQKEDDSMSDADWLALQHRAWLDELQGFAAAIDTLAYCIEHGFDASTGRRPRNGAAWPHIKHSMECELHQCRQHRANLLDDYGRYFGDAAAQRFGDHAAHEWVRVSASLDRAEAQGELF